MSEPTCTVCGEPPEPDNRLKGGAHIRYCYQWQRRNSTTQPTCTTPECGRFSRVGDSALCDRCYQRTQRGNDPAARRFHVVNKGAVCKVDWCEEPAAKLEWCDACYGWSYNNGGADPTNRRYRYARSLDDLIALVATITPDPVTGCRVSAGVFHTDLSGYAVTTIQGDKRLQRVTRMILAHALGRPIAPAHKACHTCDNPPCVERSHLWEGTAADNMRDRDTKGRGAVGVRNGRSRLDPGKARDIRDRYVAGNNQHDSNASALAAEFGVTKQTILGVVNRRTWKHVE